MTDRVRSLTVVLDRDFRTDDVEQVINTIRMIRGVSDVELGPVVDFQDHINRDAIRQELFISIIQFVRLGTKGGDKWREIKALLEAADKT